MPRETKRPAGRPPNDRVAQFMAKHGCSRATAYRKLQNKRLRLQSSHKHADRGLDPYFTPPEAVHALLNIERQHLPQCIWEPAAGDGAIIRPLRAAGLTVFASDIADYGLEGCRIIDYFDADLPPGVEAVITNPPFLKAAEFAQKAIGEVPYVALLLRTNFLESVERLPFFKLNPPARILISSRRLPMMHRQGWTGPRSTSNQSHAWFVWDAAANQKRIVEWFDWKTLAGQGSR